MDFVIAESHPRIRMFGIDIDQLTLPQAVDRVLGWLEAPSAPCRYVVTPNVDHVVLLERHLELRESYRKASLVLADGWPLVTASRWLGRPLPERVAGSDLVPQLLDHCTKSRPFSYYLLGAMPGVAEKAAQRISRIWPANRFVGCFSPPLGFEEDRQECDRILGQIQSAQPDLVIVGLGAPKQEVWLYRHHARLACKVAVAAGATIDFLAGQQVRAPVWCQRWKMEWFYRMCRDPRRLARRYLYDAVVFPRLVVREWLGQPGATPR